MQFGLNYILNCSTIVFFMYSFLPHLSFSIVRHFFLTAISSLILFFTCDITFSFTSFFHVDFFLSVTFSISISKVSAICCTFFVEIGFVILFHLFCYHLLDFSLFIAILYVMIQHQCCILYSLFCRPNSCFH